MRVLSGLAMVLMVGLLLTLTGGLLFDVLLTEPRLYP